MNKGIFSIDFWSKNFIETYNQLKGYLVSYLPNILAAILVIILGLLLAKFARYLGRKIGRLIFKISFTVEKKLRLRATKDKFSKALGLVFYWITFIYFIFLALKVLNIPGISSWIMEMVHFIPQMLSLILITVVGFLLGTFAKESIYEKSENQEGKEPFLLAQTVKYGIFTLFTLWGLGQLGVNISIITGFIAIVLAAIVGAAALGFGLGSGTHVSNLIGSYSIRRNLQIGDKITVRNHTGVIIDFSKTGVQIETTEGKVMIPAKMINEEIVVKAR